MSSSSTLFFALLLALLRINFVSRSGRVTFRRSISHKFVETLSASMVVDPRSCRACGARCNAHSVRYHFPLRRLLRRRALKTRRILRIPTNSLMFWSVPVFVCKTPPHAWRPYDIRPSQQAIRVGFYHSLTTTLQKAYRRPTTCFQTHKTHLSSLRIRCSVGSVWRFLWLLT